MHTSPINTADQVPLPETPKQKRLELLSLSIISRIKVVRFDIVVA